MAKKRKPTARQGEQENPGADDLPAMERLIERNMLLAASRPKGKARKVDAGMPRDGQIVLWLSQHPADLE